MRSIRATEKIKYMIRSINIILILMIHILYASCLTGERLSNRPIAKRLSDSNQSASTSTTSDTETEEEDEFSRPNEQIFINSDFCSCLNSKADSINNCDAFCSKKAVTAATLYASVNVSSVVSQDPRFVNLEGWCSREINDGQTNPQCALEVFDGNSTFNIEVTISKNTFTANLSTLSLNTTYIMRVVEQTSLAKTTSFQIRRINPNSLSQTLGPLRISPINEYVCINRTASVAGSLTSYVNLFKKHFYYSQAQEPTVQPPGSNLYFCHDIEKYGENDSSAFERIDLRESSFYLWSLTDSRFFDLQGPNSDPNPDEVADINNLIQDQMLSKHGISFTNNALFSTLQWFTSPGGANAQQGGTNASNAVVNLGYYLQAQVHPTTKQIFCPNQNDYNSNIPLLQVLGEFLGVPTEALYMGRSEPQSYKDQNGQVQILPEDIVFVREGNIKRIWFYYDSGTPKTPNQTAIETKRLYFYWPPDYSYPHIKKPSQVTYAVIYPTELNDAGTTQNAFSTAVPVDKRFGCIPSNQ